MVQRYGFYFIFPNKTVKKQRADGCLPFVIITLFFFNASEDHQLPCP